MSDFEQDFMVQVRGGDEVARVGKGGEKKAIDKRWFLIGGLVVLLVGALIVQNMVSSGSRETIMTKGELVGFWRCGEEAGVTFYGDGSFFWRTEADMVGEIGVFELSEQKLILDTSDQEVDNGRREYVMSAVTETGFDLGGMRCERHDDE